MKGIPIQNADGEWKEYEAHELPDGTIVNCLWNGELYTCAIKGGLPYVRIPSATGRGTIQYFALETIQNIIAIQDDNGNSTNRKMWVAVDWNCAPHLHVNRPVKRNSEWFSDTYKAIGIKDAFGMAGGDKPIEVWEYIK